MRTQKLWGLFYRVRSSSYSKWCKWVGPCGVHCLPYQVSSDIIDALRGRPFFFGTRKQARLAATKLNDDKNKTWIWVQYCVRPIKLTYEQIRKKK